jgi:hypothetical protein
MFSSRTRRLARKSQSLKTSVEVYIYNCFIHSTHILIDSSQFSCSVAKMRVTALGTICLLILRAYEMLMSPPILSCRQIPPENGFFAETVSKFLFGYFASESAAAIQQWQQGFFLPIS